MTLPRRYWHEMTTEDVAALPAERVIAVLPVAAIEQHGPHLPVYVDACIVAGLAQPHWLLEVEAYAAKA
jgi:creatinine amidohydrolase